MTEKKLYKVLITETLQKTVLVEAASEQEAHRRASDAWKNAEYILDAETFQGVEFRVRVAVLNGFTAIGGRSKLPSQPIGSPLGSWAAVSPSRSVKAKNRGRRSPAGWQISGDRPIPTPLRGHRRIADLRFVPALSRHSTPR